MLVLITIFFGVGVAFALALLLLREGHRRMAASCYMMGCAFGGYMSLLVS